MVHEENDGRGGAARFGSRLHPPRPALVDVPHPDPAVRAGTASAQIVDACVRYAAAQRYQGVTLAMLSTAAGASERRVRNAFYECCGTAPTTHLRERALREARDALLEGRDRRDSVTRVATDFGFTHLSRFASHYRAAFGERPSETVLRARQTA